MEAGQQLKLSLLHAGHIRVGTNWNFDGVISPFARLYLITDGDAWVIHQHQKFQLKPGFLYLIPSFTLSRYGCETEMEQYYLTFLEDTDTGQSVFNQLTFCYETPARPVDPHLFRRLLDINPEASLQNIDPKVYDNRANLLSFNQPFSTKPDARLIETQAILTQLLSRFMLPDQQHTAGISQTVNQYRTVLAFIHAHLQEKLTVGELAGLLGMHVDYFSRQFLAVLGVRPIDYIINKRMERAQLLMTTTDLSLQDIAEQVGISDIYYFSRLFKRRFGVPPARYRKQILLNK
ncbi:helix-turn-helix domain-containing protein [Arsenicibacter rosenii]|uniref:AraC family transcriptional regulator n=1 Tax=Arsenicibacter rosenii TaxID=1750698 RepID=A0A1S2VA85_9BACT|nr:AraC family transcriptional regulator [Arsenicibacter rosenii]OIN55579.1 AraC family transcriptional regulator [Arsenicibacter rosenii]